MFIPQGWRLDLVDIPTEKQWPVMRELAAYADDRAWDSLWVYDHFHTVPMPSDEATHEAWSLMSAFAATTSRIKLGQMCTAMGYRNPVYLAKVAATADIISGGRIQMGIGGGWYEHEWKAYGYGFPSAGVRLGMLDEGVQIMRDAWRNGRVTFQGKHYKVDGAIVAPKPLQEGGPPIWIAGGGEKVTLKIAAKYAQYTNFSSEPEVFAHKSQVLADHCRDVGTDYDAIVRSSNFNAVIGESEDDVAKRIDRIRARQVSKVSEKAVDSMLDTLKSPDAASGTPEQVVEKLQRMRDLGCEYAILNFPEAAYDRSGIEIFEQKVIPALALDGAARASAQAESAPSPVAWPGREARRSTRAAVARRAGSTPPAEAARPPSAPTGGPLDSGAVSDVNPGGSCGAGPAPGGGGAPPGIWPSGVSLNPYGSLA